MIDWLFSEFDPLRIHKFWFNAVKKYGPIIYIKALDLRIVGVTDPDDIQKVFEVTRDNPKRNGFLSMKKVRLGDLNDFFDGKAGILVEYVLLITK